MSEPQSSDGDKKSPSPSRYPAWAVGGVLILIGVIFLLKNVMGFSLNNWWALFILIPAFGSLATAWGMWEKGGRKFSAAVRGPLIGGVILVAIAVVFLLELDWGTIWPVFLIIAGGVTLLTAFPRRS
jgi:hypothetical protein